MDDADLKCHSLLNRARDLVQTMDAEGDQAGAMQAAYAYLKAAGLTVELEEGADRIAEMLAVIREKGIEHEDSQFAMARVVHMVPDTNVTMHVLVMALAIAVKNREETR